MSTEITYISSNTSLQVIDTFDVPTVSSIKYEIQIASNTEISTSTFSVTHDGTSTSEFQMGISDTGTRPIEITSDITDYVGYIRATPNYDVTTFKMVRTDVLCNNYSENTMSGKTILGDIGFGVSFDTNSATVRQDGNNQYGDPYMMFGEYIEQNPELLNTVWQSENFSVISATNNTYTITSSSFTNNYQYKVIPVQVGKVYQISGNSYYIPTEDDSIGRGQGTTGTPAIRVGDTPGSADLFQTIPVETSTAFSGQFTPSSNTIYVSAGFGKLNTKLVIDELSLKEVSPFNTYDQNMGTFYMSWDSFAANSNILKLSAMDGSIQTVSISSDNNVIITCNSGIVHSGLQLTANKLVFTYSPDGINASLNGGLMSDTSILPTKQIYKLEVINIPHELSYVPEVLSTTRITEISGG